MENLIFSLNSTIPVFLVMALGYALYHKRVLNDSFAATANRLVFQVTLPVMLFSDMAAIDLKKEFDFKYVLFCAIVTTLSICAVWGGARLFLRDSAIRGEFVQVSYRSSAAILGAAFISNIYGDSGMAPLMMIGSVPLFNIFAVLVLSLEGEGAGSDIPLAKRLKKAILEILKNPIIDSIALGLIVSAIGFDFPVMVDKTLSLIGSLTSPLALLAIGAGFQGKKAIAKLKPTIAASLIKTVVLAAIFLPAAAALGFRDQKLVALAVMLGSPATPTCYIMAKNMGHEGVLSSSTIVVTTLISSVTLTLWIFLLRSFEVIV